MDFLNHAEKKRIRPQARSDGPKVSITMSCYNCEQFIRESLDSILSQTMPQWELLVLDDASTDGTRSIIAEYSARDNRIKPFYFDTNEGPYIRQNFAIARANSGFIVTHGADDIMVPNKVQRLYEEITSDSRLGIVGTFCRDFIDKFKGVEYTEKHEFPTEHNDIVMGMISGRAHAISQGSCIIRKELFDTVGLYDENRCACDSFWLAKVAEYAYLTGALKLKNIPEFLMLRRMHSASQTWRVPYCDPRSRRRLYKQYYLHKLEETAKRLRGSSLADIKTGLKNCTCSDFVERYKDQIAKLENQPVDNCIIIDLLRSAITSFYKGRYINCIKVMDAIETMCSGFVKVFKNCDLLRAMCYFALDMKEAGLRYLNRELRNHDNPAAERFLADFDRQCATDVGGWYTENSKHYDPRVTISNCLEQSDVGDRSAQLNRLKQELASRSWEGKYELYQKFFDYVDYRQQIVAPTISVVVISWKLHPDTIKNFESLVQQRHENFQLVFVDNGAKPAEFDCLRPYIDTYIRLNQNTGAYLARNIGATFSNGRIILFLDDDGIGAVDILRSYREAFDKYVAVAVRGSIWPKDRNAPPYSGHENYGPRPFPYYSCQEGNFACKLRVFFQVGGWDDHILRGGGGLDLSLRLLRVEPDMRKQIYWPKAVLYHDQVKNDKTYKDKVEKLEASVVRLRLKHPDYDIFQACYKKYLQHEDLLIRNNAWKIAETDARRFSEHLYHCQELFRFIVKKYNDMGLKLWQCGDTQKALKCLLSVFKIDPFNQDTVFNICRIYKSLNRAKDAEKLLLAYLRYKPDDVEALKELKLLNPTSAIAGPVECPVSASGVPVVSEGTVSSGRLAKEPGYSKRQTNMDESLADSELNTVIPPQIKDDEFYFIIQKVAKKADVKTIIEIGSSSGDGSTEAIVTGMRQNPNRPTLYCMEVAKPRFAELQNRYADNPNVKPYNASSIPLGKFPTEQEVCSFYFSTKTSLNNYPIERVLGWLRQDVEYVKKAGVPGDGIGIVKRDNNVKDFDMVLIDGSEFTGSAELDELYGAKYVLLDDINAFKNYNNFKRLMADPDYSLVVENRTARNGFAVFRRDAGTAALTDRYTDSARELAKASTGKRIDTTVASEPGGQQEHRLRFSVGMIAFNAELFLQTCLESIYDFAHEILIVEGSCPQALWDANSEGTSQDNTLKIIENFPDPDNKIKLVASRRWGHKDEMVNAYIPYVTGDYLFQVDSDEIWTQDMLQRIQQVLAADPSITCLEFNPLHFWHNFETVLVEGHWEAPFMRIFRFEPGARWKSHEPPILLNPWGQAYNNMKKNNATEKFGITFFHYSYLTEQQARWKGEFFKRYYDLSKVPSSDRSTRVGMTRDWFEKVWFAWRTDPAGVEAKYGTTPGGGPAWRPLGRTKPFYGQHPRAVLNHPLWSQAKYHRSGWERKGLIETVHNKPKAPSTHPPDAAMSRKKNVLVSYITAPLRMGPDYHPFKFSNPGIARSMVKVLTQMGYVVDVIDFNCKNFKSDKVYDLFVGHAGVNWEQLSRNVVGDAVKIYFSTSLYWGEFNRREAQRFDRLQKRRGVRLPYDRWIKVSEEFAVHDADGIVSLGNQLTRESYSKFPVCLTLNNGTYRDDHYDVLRKDFEAGRRNFLYFGSAGNIHKGLDLLVEAFMQIDDAELWYAGKVDPGFYDIYGKDLKKHPNIHFVHDDRWMKLRSDEFYGLIDKCNCVILPSCAEGSCGGVVECMNQGLIPIVSRGATIDVGDFGIMLETDSVDQIVRVVREVMAKPAQWHRQRSIATRQTVLRDFSEEAFCRNLQRAIEGVVRQTPQVRIMREKVASQAQDNPTQYLNKYADNLGALLRGAAHLKSNNRHDEAAQLLQRAVIVDLSCATAICRLGLYYAKRAQMTRAEKLVERALEFCPGDKQCLAILQKIRQTPMSVPKHDTVNSYANEFVAGRQIRSGVDADISGSYINI